MLSVPDALVIHPYWKNFSVKHFFNWTQGDGLLIDKYPEFVYFNYPTFPETIGLVCFLWIGLAIHCGGFSDVEYFSTLAFDIYFPLWLAYLTLVEFSMDLYHYFYVDPDVAAEVTGYGIRRFLGSLQATYTKNAVETGHLWVHLKRGKIFNIFKHFDWNCGTNKEAIDSEKRKAKFRFLLNIIPALLFLISQLQYVFITS